MVEALEVDADKVPPSVPNGELLVLTSKSTPLGKVVGDVEGAFTGGGISFPVQL
jgi:hypothetical protein